MTVQRVDVLVVGGGPGGLVAARELARADPGLEILLVERDRAVGAPVRCGEGVGSRGLEEFIAPDDSFISRRITRVIFWAPDGSEVRVAEGDVGYVLDRTRFEPALAAEAAREGVDIAVGTEATGMARDADGRWQVALRGATGQRTISARLVIGADGVEGMVGRWAGLDTRVPSRDMESCAQYVVTNIDFDPDAIYLHFGDGVAPGGYAWVFPKGVGVANVGLGVVALRGEGKPARRWLDEYLATYFPTGVRIASTVGGVIVHPTIKRTVADGVLLCGDAAHMVNPLSGGGIVNAMKAGRLAAATAAAALRAGDVSEARLRRYHAEWMALLGDDHVRFHRVKDALNRLGDSFFNDLARTVERIPIEKRTLGRIFTHALVRQPSLMPVIAKYFV